MVFSQSVFQGHDYQSTFPPVQRGLATIGHPHLAEPLVVGFVIRDVGFAKLFDFLVSCYFSQQVSDWWEEYIYLAGRDPIMSNSNFYGLEWMRTRPIRPTQAASAAMITYLMCQVRRQLIREEVMQSNLCGL